MTSNIERDVRFLKYYAVGSTALLTILLLCGFTQRAKRPRFGEIDVERINVIEPSGKLDLAISNAERFPPPISNGKVGKRVGRASPGIIFYNGKGDEAGALAYDSHAQEGQYDAGSILTFDQYAHDQTLALMYQDGNGNRWAGLKVWDHSGPSLSELEDKSRAIQQMQDGPEKKAALQKLGQDWGVERVFLGKQVDRSATLVLSAPDGSPRIRISVDANGHPRLSFLDASGKETYALPERK